MNKNPTMKEASENLSKVVNQKKKTPTEIAIEKSKKTLQDLEEMGVFA